jgi:hypothetical protein
MGFWSVRLLEGTKNKCINYYLSDMAERYRAAIRSGFSDSPHTIVNIHIELAPNYFHDLDVFLRFKGNFSPSEIDAHFLDAEAKALATICKKFGHSYEEVESIISDKAYDLAEIHFDVSLTPQENFSRLSSGKELSRKSVLFRQWVLVAFNFIQDQEV